MAEDKAALVDKIQKLVTKGDWNRALVELQKLNSVLEGKDLRVRMKIAELLAKTGKKEEGVNEYIQVAESYATNGFLAQAVAVNKVIVKLDPSREDVYKRLADLQKQSGLVPALPLKTVIPAPAANSQVVTDEAKPASSKRSVPRAPLFSDLTPDELAYLSEKVGVLNVQAGNIIFKEGDPGNSILILTSGEVKIMARNSKGEEVEVSHFKEGDFFGEFAYFSNSTRQATAVALVDCELLELTKELLLDVSKQHPRVNEVLMSFYKERVVDKVMGTSELFRHLERKDRKEILQKLRFQAFEAGTLIIHEGCAGDYLFLIKSGKADITTWRDEQEVLLATIDEGEFFGEISLVTGTPRTASVRARTPLEVLKLSKADLEEVASKHPKIRKVIDDIIKKRVENTIKVVLDMKEIWKNGLV